MVYSGGPFHSALDEDEEVLGRIYDWRVIRRLPPYLALVKSWMVLGAIGMVIRSLASLALPYLMAIAADRFIRTGDLYGLNIIAGAFVGATLLAWAGQYMETLFLSYASETALLQMRTQMFDHLQQLSLSFYDRNKVGKIMSRVQSDVQQIQELLTADILNIVVSILTLVAIACVMMMMNTRLALLTLSVVPVFGLVIFIWQQYARRAFFRVRGAIALTLSFRKAYPGCE